MVRVPVRGPVAVGVKESVMWQDPPGAAEKQLLPDTVKSPVAETLLRFKVKFPELVIVSN